MSDARTQREILLKAARDAGDRYIRVRGVDLVAALSAPSYETKPSPSKKE